MDGESRAEGEHHARIAWGCARVQNLPQDEPDGRRGDVAALGQDGARGGKVRIGQAGGAMERGQPSC